MLAGTFDLLVYTDAASDVPTEWEDSDPRYIQNAADVKLRSFTTKVRCHLCMPTNMLRAYAANGSSLIHKRADWSVLEL